MDKNKCPKMKTEKNFPNVFFTLLYNKLKKVLKAEYTLLIISRKYYITQKYTKKILCK